MMNGQVGYVLWLGDRMIGTGGLFMPRDAARADVIRAVREQAQESCKGKAVKFTIDGMVGPFALWPSEEPRTVSCGCCTQGCVCWNHRDEPQGRPMQRCAYHVEHGHPRVTSPLVSRDCYADWSCAKHSDA